MLIIDSTTVRVDSFLELSSVLTANEYTYIYLGTDIVMTSGIRLNNNRTLAVIDGEYPAGSGIFHSLADAGGDIGMIYKENISSLELTLQNMTIKGKNYFGMPHIFSGNTDVTVTYRNVTYTGPQMTWHVSGKTRYIDCDVTIQPGGVSAMQEVGEVCQVEIGGKTTIRYGTNTGFPVFNFYRSNASFTILADAQVEIDTAYDFFIHASPLPFVIQPRASFHLTTGTGISRTAGYRAASVLVDSNANFHYTQRGNSLDLAAFYVDGNFTVNKGANVYMEANFPTTSTRRLLQFTGASARRLQLNDPKRFVLYTQGQGTALGVPSATPFYFYGEQVNYWRTAGSIPSAGSFDDPPLYPWHNANWSKFSITGSASSSATSVSNTTLTATDPDLSNLKLQEVRVLSVGNLPLQVNPVVDDQTPITGTSDPNAVILVTYTDAGGSQTLRGTADGSGAFSIPTPAAIPVETKVTISANVPFLYKTLIATVVAAGALTIESAPDLIKFIAPSISPQPNCILGRSSNVPVVVKDTRVYSTLWKLSASIDGPMRSTQGRILPGNVIFVPTVSAFDDEEPIDPGTYTRVHIGGPFVVTTKVEWVGPVGILLHITGAIHLEEKYTANLLWRVEPYTP